MTDRAGSDATFVETAARLHFGVLDLRGGLGRWFGGIGAAAPAPTLLVSARAAGTVAVDGVDTDRAAGFVRAFHAHHRLDRGVSVTVHRTLPPHAGLGSATQLALAIARALAEVYGLPGDPAALAAAVGRGQRSAVGTWTFAGGGLVVEGGRRLAHDGVGPLLVRLPFPPAWRCVVAVPHAASAISGADEAAAFTKLPPPPDGDIEQVAHLVLMGLLPALVERDLDAFGRALTAIQTMTGRWFAAVQGGPFARGPTEELIRRMAEWGAPGVGQSSWGPAVYAIVDGADDSARLAERVSAALAHCGGGSVYEGPFRSEGARVWTARSS